MAARNGAQTEGGSPGRRTLACGTGRAPRTRALVSGDGCRDFWAPQEKAVGSAPAVVLRQDGSSAGYLLGWVRCHGRGNKYHYWSCHAAATASRRRE